MTDTSITSAAALTFKLLCTWPKVVGEAVLFATCTRHEMRALFDGSSLDAADVASATAAVAATGVAAVLLELCRKQQTVDQIAGGALIIQPSMACGLGLQYPNKVCAGCKVVWRAVKFAQDY